MRRASLLGLLLAVGLAPAPASAWCRMTTSTRAPSGGSEPCVLPRGSELFLAWTRPCSAVSLSYTARSNDLDDETVYGALERAIGAWEAVQCGGAPVGVQIGLLADPNSCTVPLYRDDGGNVNSLMFIEDWEGAGYDSGAFAITTVWHRRSTGEILDVDIEINEQRGPYAICPEAGCAGDRAVDLQNVLTHELGHYLGLAHSQARDATMFASASPGETDKRTLDVDDAQGLCEIYPAGSPSAACDPTPVGGLDLDCDTGCSVRAPGDRPRSPAALLLAAMAIAGALRQRRTR